jgi:gamma-glutamylcyclotransferase (GGCT)/AIG2-like uncharacterized protein YtfP
MNTTDFHAWNEINGKVYDYDTKGKELKKVYDKIAMMRLKTTEYEFIHKKWDSPPAGVVEQRKEIIETIEEGDYKMLWNLVKNTFGRCFARAMLIECKNKSAIIVYGSLGLKCRKTGNIWWEHGNGKDTQ